MAKKSGIELYLKRIFAVMFAAVGLTALTTYATLRWGLPLIITESGSVSPLFYIVLFAAFGLSLFAQARAFKMSAAGGAGCLAIYSAAMGFCIAPLVAFALAVNPVSVLQAFVIAALMFGCMALFGYKTTKDLSFMGVFLFIGMIGLIITGIISMFWPFGSTANMIVSIIGVLVFALFTAYDMQFLKNAYNSVPRESEGQLAVLGALHLYISFIAMFQYVLSLLNRR
ncbi:MAG: Bax inhibitor-1/YccA family protein [Rickettsiales bacterium]|jgi:FtsH-binding integral membrane protein|nr:Bax inhibitor-1/YccA family protein [Rickettsiales bacterium]